MRHRNKHYYYDSRLYYYCYCYCSAILLLTSIHLADSSNSNSNRNVPHHHPINRNNHGSNNVRGYPVQQQQSKTGWFDKLLGSNSSNDDDNDHKEEKKEQDVLGVIGDDSNVTAHQRHDSNLYSQQQYYPPPPPPYPQPYYETNVRHHPGYSHQFDILPPPPPVDEFSANSHDPINYYQKDDHNNNFNQYHKDDEKVWNLTTQVEELTALAEERLDMVDKLREQLADAESFAASESNAALEQKANCTFLAEQNQKLLRKVDYLSGNCTSIQEALKISEQKKSELAELIEEKQEQMEALSCVIENSRFQQARATLDDRGFFQRLWSSIFVTRDDSAVSKLKNAQDLSRSTLISALQQERSQVEELENELVQLELNNSLSSELINSRDSLIEELNSRISVFEEDKIVLKAALKQLQKEMRDEIPIKAKLEYDLSSAQIEITVLNEEIGEISKNHEISLSHAEDTIFNREAVIKELESKMSEIGLYVDQLEERLSIFKLAQRESRGDLEDQIENVTKVYSEQLTRVSQLEHELKEAKTELIEARRDKVFLAEERTKLQLQLELQQPDCLQDYDVEDVDDDLEDISSSCSASDFIEEEEEEVKEEPINLPQSQPQVFKKKKILRSFRKSFARISGTHHYFS